MERENNEARNGPKGTLRDLVATCVKTGMPPEKIFAVIKTARILTEQNSKFLSKADVKEWEDACVEYETLAGISRPPRKKRR